MKITIPKPIEVDVRYVHIRIPLQEGDVPKDFPFKSGQWMSIDVNVDTGAIEDWALFLGALVIKTKLFDQGRYTLMEENSDTVAEISYGPVPHGLIPGEDGNSIHLDIDENGVITNWPKEPNFDEFLEEID